MVAKVLVAIAVGFAVSIPLTFWLLKKVRIKSKVRHFQVLIVLGFLTLLFFYVLQTRFVWFVVNSLALILLALLSTELLLRKLVADNISTSSKISYPLRDGSIGHQIAFEQAQIDSGYYPFDYLTLVFWGETQTLIRDTLLKNRMQLNHLSLFEKFRDYNFNGKTLNISNGVRRTTGVTNEDVTLRIFVLGGSTVFCYEVPDSLTVTSFLQKILNQVSNQTKVLNFGWAGASVLDRIKALKTSADFNKNDIVIVYFGVNDAGYKFTDQNGNEQRAEDLLPIQLRVAKILAEEIDLVIARWVYGETAPRRLQKFVNQATNQTTETLTAFEEYCRTNELRIMAVLQPNLYTLRTKYPSEVQAEKRFSNNLRTVILHAYKHYEEWVKETPYAVSATHIFDNAPAPVFLDWAHVNARGNEIIARFIFEELQRRGMLGSDSKL